MSTSVDYKELLKYSIGRIVSEAQEIKGNKDRDYRQTLLQGYYNCLLTIRNDVLIWHPCKTEEEETAILEEFGLNFPIEQILE